MIKSKTVFIVGAGASYDAGFPVGDDLKGRIAEVVTADGALVHDEIMRQAVNAYLASPERPSETAVDDELRRMAHGIFLTPSIDNYLHNNRDNKIAVALGKLAIARVIGQCEKDSALANIGKTGTSVLKTMWYSHFAQLLTEGVTQDNIDGIFENISFIIFNYDRCIEHFLFHMLQFVFGMPAADAAALVNQVPIIHPYGQLGRLPWREASDRRFDFGGNFDGNGIYLRSSKLRTFTEEQSDLSRKAEIEKLITEAHLMVFLGFGFIPLNMDLLRPTRSCEARCIIGSCYGVSDDNRNAFGANIKTSFRNGNVAAGRLVLTEKDVEGKRFFTEYASTLRGNY